MLPISAGGRRRNMSIAYLGTSSLALLTLNWGIFNIGVHALSTPRPAKNTASFLDNAIIDDSSVSLATLISSPERYAAALNMTVEQIQQTKNAHEQASEALHRELASDALSGPQKHTLLCRHRLEYGRHPFACPRCWSYLPVCVCSRVRPEKISMQPGDDNKLSVVVWTHHREWGLTSNTGGLLGLMLEDCHVLMKGLPEHDSQFDELIQDPENLVVVLWPDQNNGYDPDVDGDTDVGGYTSSRYMSLEQVRDNKSQKKRIVLVAVDGTWRNARRMVARLPREKIFFTDLSEETVQKLFLDTDCEKPNHHRDAPGSQSLLAPLRGRGPNTDENQVCTAEAVAGALLQLGIDEKDVEDILSLARQKVDLICRYRAKVPTSMRG